MRSVISVLAGQIGSNDFASICVNANVKFASGAPRYRSVLFDQPFSSAAQFQAGAVDDQVERARRSAARFLDLQAARPASYAVGLAKTQWLLR